MYGWQESEARAELTRLGLVAAVTYRTVVNKCYVIEQTPSGRTVVEVGSTVDIVVAEPTGTCEMV
jgi:beta-lactam-binding protein with PASTA domain